MPEEDIIKLVLEAIAAAEDIQISKEELDEIKKSMGK